MFSINTLFLEKRRINPEGLENTNAQKVFVCFCMYLSRSLRDTKQWSIKTETGHEARPVDYVLSCDLLWLYRSDL